MNAILDLPVSNTEHGLLVAFGEFLQQHGFIQRLMAVPIKQKTVTFAPQSKLVELLAGIMSGIESLSDLNEGPRPLAYDPIVARAWEQTAFAHYSSVSRTLAACDDESIAAVQRAIDEFSQPFIRQAVHALRCVGLPLVYDLDLMGQAVSATSTSYPQAAFGWMDDQVRLGYQVARVCLSTQTHERLWLAGLHHPGDTVSSRCVQALIHAAEAQTGVRPRRRTELLRQRIAQHQLQLQRPQRLLTQQQRRQQHLHRTQQRLREHIFQAAQAQKMPVLTGKAARLAQQAQGWRKRLPRLEQQLAACEHLIAHHQQQLHQLSQEQAHLQDWLKQLEADNHTNPDPPTCEARMDSGFSSGANLSWLIEMGYRVNTKAPNDKTTCALRQIIPADAHWTRVGDNAEMIAHGDYLIHDCPYALTVALERFKVGDTFRYATLLQFRDDGLCPSLPVWFKSYNARQLIEAGNKESKSGVFQVQQLLSRSPAGIRLQVMFVGLAANVVRWARPWLRACAPQPTPKLLRILNSPKHLVRVAVNSAARVQQSPMGTSLQFAPTSALSGTVLFLKGVPAFQLPLSFS
jgi:hypothetical protein